MKHPNYAILGHPVAHSRSPFIHALFARQSGLAMDYGRLLSPLDDFAGTLRDFAAQGGRGCNVTLPFKFEALALAGGCSARARLAGAANTLRRDGSTWWADNTDGVGLVRDLEQGALRSLASQRMLLIGAGGAAAGVLGPLLQAAPACVVVANRTVAKAKVLVERHRDLAQKVGVALQAAGLDNPGSGFDIVLNASVSSLQGQAAPVPPTVLARGALALDLMYGPDAEPFMAWARQAGASARDGLGMLVEQAAEAFFVWHGQRPQTAPVLAALRAEIEAGR